MLSITSHSGLITGFSMGRSESMGLDISHLLFAVGPIIFCDNNCEQIINLSVVGGHF